MRSEAKCVVNVLEEAKRELNLFLKQIETGSKMESECVKSRKMSNDFVYRSKMRSEAKYEVSVCIEVK